MTPGAFLVLTLLAVTPAQSAPASPETLERIRGMAERWESGELSPAEKDDLLRSVVSELLRTGTLETPLTPPPAQAEPASGHKVIAVYPDRNTTQLVIEARQPLVAGTLVYAGPEEIQVTLDDLLARSRGLYYYSASTPGRARIRINDPVVTRESRKLETHSPLRLKIEETYTFEQKRLGEITAVQDGRAMIDRGTLHEVRERDIYKLFDASGAYKGFLEIRGIGDLQSSGVLYNRMEDRRRRAQETAPGDRAVFVGQRKLLALGALGGIPLALRSEFGIREKAVGGGLAWDLMFKNGWGGEVLFGWFQREIDSGSQIRIPAELHIQQVSWKASYYAPLLIRKNFFFPSTASPFLAAGATIVEASLRFHDFHFVPGGGWEATHQDRVTTVAPILGAGVDFFPARLIRPRVEVRWIDGPTLRADHKTLKTETFLGAVSLFTAW